MLCRVGAQDGPLCPACVALAGSAEVDDVRRMAVLYIPVFDGFDELDAVAPFEMLSSAGLDVRLVVLAGRSLRVRARHGLVLEASGAIDAAGVAKDDWVIAIGGGY